MYNGINHKRRKDTTMVKRHIYIIACGGTIAGAAGTADDLTGYTAGAVAVEDLIAAVPQLSETAFIEGEQFCSIDSSDMTEELWLRLAQRVQTIADIDDIDGIVITHGTDTMEETAYFLSLTVHTEIPVILTGAMRPATAISADGPLNLLEAVQTAAWPESSRYGVLIAINGTLQAPRFVEKTDTTHVDTFRSRQMGCLGFIQDGRPWFYQMPVQLYNQTSCFSCAGLKELPKVGIVYGYVGMDGAVMDAMAAAGARAVVVAGLGHGRMPAAIWKKAQQLMERGIYIIRASRVLGGIVTAVPEYDGTICANTLTPQKAKILMQLILLRTQDKREIQDFFQLY